MKDSGGMARQGFALCAKGTRHTFYALTHRCDKHQPAQEKAIAKRRELLKG